MKQATLRWVTAEVDLVLKKRKLNEGSFLTQEVISCDILLSKLKQQEHNENLLTRAQIQYFHIQWKVINVSLKQWIDLFNVFLWRLDLGLQLLPISQMNTRQEDVLLHMKTYWHRM